MHCTKVPCLAAPIYLPSIRMLVLRQGVGFAGKRDITQATQLFQEAFKLLGDRVLNEVATVRTSKDDVFSGGPLDGSPTWFETLLEKSSVDAIEY
jgi:hypothetical protein